MKLIFLATFLTVLFFVEESSSQCLSVNDTRLPNKNTRLGLYTGQQEFSLALLNAINQLMPNDNLFFSPYSTYHALLIAYFISGNQTENYLKKALRLNQAQTKIDVYDAYKLDKFTTMVRTQNASYSLTNANKIFVSDQVPIRECVSSYFLEELSKAAFQTNPEGARESINHWVEAQTHDMIKDLLPPGAISPETNLVLVNAAYFKGVWENKFNTNQTRKEIFYVNPSKQIMVDMMHVEGTFKHDVSEVLGAHILELPYEGNQISMYIFLPPFTKEDAIQETLKRLTIEEFKNIIESGNLITKTVKVALPKFSLEQTIEMVPILQKLGVGDLFTPQSDLSTLTNSRVDLGESIHKAKIEVNEMGTKAAAATVHFTFRSRAAEPADFVCNHPFVYLIYDNIEKSILFMGVFRRPY